MVVDFQRINFAASFAFVCTLWPFVELLMAIFRFDFADARRQFQFQSCCCWLENLRLALDLFLGRSRTPEFDTTGWLAGSLDGAHTDAIPRSLSLSPACSLLLRCLRTFSFLFNTTTTMTGHHDHDSDFRPSTYKLCCCCCSQRGPLAANPS